MESWLQTYSITKLWNIGSKETNLALFHGLELEFWKSISPFLWKGQIEEEENGGELFIAWFSLGNEKKMLGGGDF